MIPKLNQMIVKELITAIHENRDVIVSSSGRDDRAALEMIMGVHESQRLESRVTLPLKNRDNPYETWIKELEKEQLSPSYTAGLGSRVTIDMSLQS